MEEDAAIHPCLFRWNISSPFVPWRRLEATFYHTLPVLTAWKVTFEPDHRRTNYWSFQIILRAVRPSEPLGIISTNRIEVNVSINGEHMTQNVQQGYTFSRRNLNRCRIDSFAHTVPLFNRPHLLTIDIEITFPRWHISHQDNGLLYDELSVMDLSNDMEALFASHSYYDLTLQSKNQTSIFYVHSYIIQARWREFFRVHHTIVENTVDTNISGNLLWNILHYIYSGRLITGGPNWGVPEYMTELFKVIDRYHLQHLHEVFARDDARQVRTTTRSLIINSVDFPLDDEDGIPLHTPCYSLRVNPLTDCIIDFGIKFYLHARRPFFEYLIISRSPMRLHAQVNLEFRKEPGRARSTHQCDYTINSEQEVNSGTCYFEGIDELLTAFINGTGRRYWRETVIRHSIRFIFYLSNGDTVIEIESDDDIGLLNAIERVNVLSDHMLSLIRRPTETDFQVLCPTELPPNPDRAPFVFHLHRSIFEARIPQWGAVLGDNLEEDGSYPEHVMFDIITYAFHEVLVYIYTGKLTPGIYHLLDEVDNFATLGKMEALKSFVNDLRLAVQNQ